jgi:hypothetical protein
LGSWIDHPPPPFAPPRQGNSFPTSVLFHCLCSTNKNTCSKPCILYPKLLNIILLSYDPSLFFPNTPFPSFSSFYLLLCFLHKVIRMKPIVVVFFFLTKGDKLL